MGWRLIGGLPRVRVVTCTGSPVPSDPCRSPLPPLVQLVAAGHSVAEMRALLAPMLSSGHDQASSNTLTHHPPLIHLPLKHTPKSKSKLIQYYTPPPIFLIFLSPFVTIYNTNADYSVFFFIPNPSCGFVSVQNVIRSVWKCFGSWNVLIFFLVSKILKI